MQNKALQEIDIIVVIQSEHVKWITSSVLHKYRYSINY